MLMNLTQKKCVPCEGGVHPLQGLGLAKYQAELSSPWEEREGGRKIYREFKFKNFALAMKFTNQIAEIAEEEQHHPELTIGWGHVGVQLSTHAINGLSENDFILASKIEALKN